MVDGMMETTTRLVPRRIARNVPEDVLRADLEKYRLRALELGAADAAIISARDVVIDERVRLKCAFPRCHLYGETPNCPPYTPPPEEMRRALARYEYAVLFKHDVTPVEDFADKKRWHQAHMAHQGRTDEVVAKIEALAFNDGHYFAVGFGAGGCKTALCRGLTCQFLDSGRCRFPLKSRPSMEGVGIDVFDLVAKMGWEVYPLVHEDVDALAVPCAVSVGIVFVR